MTAKKLWLLLFIIIQFACNSDESTSEFNTNPPADLGESYSVDETNKLILYNGPVINLSTDLKIGEESATIETTDLTLQRGKAYSITYKGDVYQLYQTELPIVVLNSGNQEIIDDPKVGGMIQVLESGESAIEYQMGIELRGGVSQTYPKKSFSVELWEDPQGDETVSESLLGLREDDDWILDGLWNEPLRLRDFVCHDLWLKIGRNPYEEEEPKSILGINRKFVEVFLNGKYRGVYYLGEKVDRKQLKLKKYDSQLTGELYKGSQWADGVTFDGVEDFNNNEDYWSGYEAKYPDDIGELDWTNLHDLVNFVVNSDQNTFDASISEKVDMANMVDYFIFMNMTYAEDNRGKNLYTARYNQNSPYFFVVWDMDGTFGSFWTGERIDITDDILSNGLYNKLLLNSQFKIELETRWNELKNNELSISELQNMFEVNYRYLKDNGIYEREALDSELPQLYSETEIDFIKDWIQRRHAFLDTYFNNL